MLRAWTTLALIPIPHLNPTTPTSNLNQKLRGMDDLVTALEMYHPGDGFQLRVLRQTAGEGIGAAFSTGSYSTVDLRVVLGTSDSDYTSR